MTAKTDMSKADFLRWISQRDVEMNHFRAALFEAENILSDLDHEYQKDECCDAKKIGKLIGRGATFVSIRRAR